MLFNFATAGTSDATNSANRQDGPDDSTAGTDGSRDTARGCQGSGPNLHTLDNAPPVVLNIRYNSTSRNPAGAGNQSTCIRSVDWVPTGVRIRRPRDAYRRIDAQELLRTRVVVAVVYDPCLRSGRPPTTTLSLGCL